MNKYCIADKKANNVTIMNVILFTAYGVKPEDILSDLWVFCHNAKVTEERLQLAIESGCERPKPWICHATPDIFERLVAKCFRKYN